MSWWNSAKQQIIRFPSKPVPDYPGWEIEDCGCCLGIQWGGQCPIECNRCNGTGVVYRHQKSGVVAEYPGGKFV